MKTLLGAAAVALLLGAPALAQSDVPPEVCETQATTIEMKECAAWQLSVADRWLNQVYAIVRDEQDEQGQRLLRDAQRAWIAFRDASCAFEADGDRGGTLAGLTELGCLTVKTEQRARELNAPLQGVDPPAFSDVYSSNAVGAFTCDGTLTEARLGLEPLMEAEQPVEVRLVIGGESLGWAIDPRRQDALCGAAVSLELIRNPVNPQCPAVAVSDGLCDRIVVYWDGTQFMTERN